MKKRRYTYEEQVTRDYENGQFKSMTPSKSDLKRFKEAARATFIKNRRVNVRLSTPDLIDIQTRAAEEGIPYQTLIASVLHKFVTGPALSLRDGDIGNHRGSQRGRADEPNDAVLPKT